MRERWVEEFAARAADYWTPARTEEVTRGKNVAILPGEAPLLWRSIGLLHRDASMPPAQVRKYFQINHLLAALGPSLAELRERHRIVRVLDAGCGRSYLTFLIAWSFVHRFGHPVQILGVELRPALVEECRRRAELVGLEDVVRFEAGAIDATDVDAAYARAFGEEGPVDVHVVASLHACDTATDDAIALGLRRRADLLAIAPCCHAELAAKWAGLAETGSESDFAPLFRSPHLRREAAATVTDAMRAALVRAAGYDVSALEFVPSEHTPKNTLIRAMRRADSDPSAFAEYAALERATGGCGIALAERLPAGLRAELSEVVDNKKS